MAQPVTVPNVPIVHAHFTGAIKPHYNDFPDYFKINIDLLNQLNKSIKVIQDRKISLKSGALEVKVTHGEWSKNVSNAIKDAYFTLKAKHPELLELYFAGESPSSLTTDKKKIKKLEELAALSNMPDRPELKEFTQKLVNLRIEGLNLTDKKGETKSDGKSGSTELDKVLHAYHEQYQKIKYLMRGYFYGTDVDYTTLFKDIEQATHTHSDKPVLIPVSTPERKPS